MSPLTMKDEDNREWMAIGLNPETGEVLWIPGDTEVVAFSLTEDEADETVSKPNHDSSHVVEVSSSGMSQRCTEPDCDWSKDYD